MRIAVTGGRYMNDHKLVHGFLDRFHEEYGVTVLIHGDATGADRSSAEWAENNGLITEAYPADWKTHGKYDAGFIRNQQMIDEAVPDGVICFPGHNGTADMVSRAKKAGIEVWECSY